MSLYLCRNGHVVSHTDAHLGGLECAKCRANDRRRADRLNAKAYEVRVVHRATGRLLAMPKVLTGAAAKAELERRNKAAADRNARSKAELLKAGGRRLTVNLSADATAALAEIRERTPADTDKLAVEYALQAYAAILARKGKKA